MRESSITDTRQMRDILLSPLYSSSECVLSAKLFEAASFIQTKKLEFDIFIEETH